MHEHFEPHIQRIIKACTKSNAAKIELGCSRTSLIVLVEDYDRDICRKSTLQISIAFEDGAIDNLSETEWSQADPFICMYLPTHNLRQDGSYRIWVEFNRGSQMVKFTTHSNIQLGGKMVPMTAKLMEMTRGQIQNMEVK